MGPLKIILFFYRKILKKKSYLLLTLLWKYTAHHVISQSLSSAVKAAVLCRCAPYRQLALCLSQREKKNKGPSEQIDFPCNLRTIAEREDIQCCLRIYFQLLPLGTKMQKCGTKNFWHLGANCVHTHKYSCESKKRNSFTFF